MKVHPVFHVSLLKRYCPSPAEFGDRHPNRPPPTIVEEREEWEVESILEERIRRRKKEYLVKWKGYGREEATWQTKGDLKNATRVLEAWENAKN
jgi:hypothetical protein